MTVAEAKRNIMELQRALFYCEVTGDHSAVFHKKKYTVPELEERYVNMVKMLPSGSGLTITTADYMEEV